MNKHDPNQPQRINLRYAIPDLYLNRSLSYSKAEAVKRLIENLAVMLAEAMICERKEYDATIFELNGYFVTPRALDKLVQDRLHKIQAGYPIVDFY